MGFFGDLIDSFIGSNEEAVHYKNAGLKTGTTGGRPALHRTDINLNQREPWGEHRTNLERMKLGWAPIDKDNETIELHHIWQKPNSPLAELTYKEHRGAGSSGLLHGNNSKGSEFYGKNNRGVWKKEQKQYWKDRAADFSSNNATDIDVESITNGITSLIKGVADIVSIFTKK